jgi:hypothetical protein
MTITIIMKPDVMALLHLWSQLLGKP